MKIHKPFFLLSFENKNSPMKTAPTFYKIYCCLALLVMACSTKPKSPYANSVIATAHPLATQAGEAIFAQGGNAFDAAIAAAFTLSVVEPSMSGIGGRLQAIYQTSGGNIAGVDATTEVPENYAEPKKQYAYGYPTIGIPGVVAGLIKLHQEQGSLPLAVLMAPSINLAEQGFELLPGEALRQAGVVDQLKEFEGTRQYFLKSDSSTLKPGERLIQKDLAQVLKKIATEGRRGFYEGEIAQKMVDDIQAHGGILTLDDLKNYTARSSRILNGMYQGYTIYSPFLPSYGAITIQILQILDHLSPSKSEEEWVQQLGKATEIAYRYRNFQKNDDSLATILSYEKAAQWAKQIQSNRVALTRLIDDSNAVPVSWTSIDGHTTHLTAADQWGNSIALTQTVGPTMGSKVATKGLGFIYAVTLGGYLGSYKPGDRVNSHISPTLVTTPEGKVQIALGAAGGSRIVTAITQVLSRYLGQKLTLKQAMLLPRVYPYEDSLWIENHSEIEEFNATFDTTTVPVKYIDEIAKFGRVHAVAKAPDRAMWIGAADPDWEGTTASYAKE